MSGHWHCRTANASVRNYVGLPINEYNHKLLWAVGIILKINRPKVFIANFTNESGLLFI
jgi:hypothetical protein